MASIEYAEESSALLEFTFIFTSVPNTIATTIKRACDLAMRFFALVCLIRSESGVYLRTNRSQSWGLNPAIEIGAGFFVLAAITTIFLSSALFSVSPASQVCFIGSVLIIVALLSDYNYRHTLLK